MPQAARTPRLPPEERRRELLDAALDLIYEHGFAAVSIEAVARRAGVTRPVVYDQFGSLDALLVALLDREEQAALAPLLALLDEAPQKGAAPEELLAEGVDEFLVAVRANPRTWRLVLMPPQGGPPQLRARIAASRRMIATRMTELIDWGVDKRGGPSGLDHPLLARVIVAAGEDAARLTLRHPRRFPPARIAQVVREGVALLPAGRSIESAPGIAPVPPVHPPEARAPDATARMTPAQRRARVLDAALDLVAESGFESLNVRLIAERAGINRALVYRSFPNLKLLLLALLEREDRRTRRTIDALVPLDLSGHTVPEMLEGAVATLLDGVGRHPQTYRLVLQRPESAPPFLQKLVNRRRGLIARRLRPVIEVGLGGAPARAASASPGPRADAELIARLLLSAGEELGRLVLDDPEFPPERLMAGVRGLLSLLPR